MKIAIISDTHDDIIRTKEVLQEIKKQGITKIIHLGDYCSPFMVDLFKEFEVHTVFGNNDGDLFKLIQKMNALDFVVEKDLLELELNQKKFVLYHGTNQKIIDALIKSQTYDFVLHGHTHEVRNEKHGKTTVLNPGTINKSLSDDNVSTYIILNLKTMEVEILKN